jgi:hypothetical protein
MTASVNSARSKSISNCDHFGSPDSLGGRRTVRPADILTNHAPDVSGRHDRADVDAVTRRRYAQVTMRSAGPHRFNGA